jgi:Protein of unknown function (DUF1588)/Protein of unknown function (DUF1592)/Protein of unknown function (DUF1595)/Protein of unknown function (DUF1587)/Protein of unknown function (DUF1585)
MGWAIGLLVLTTSACYQGRPGWGDGATAGGDGADDGADGADDGADDGELAGCDESSVSPLRRLSEAQYRNTLRDLFAPAGLDVETEIATDLDRIPVDDAGSSFGILDTRVSDQHVRAYYRIADGLSYAVVANADHVTAVAGACAVGGKPDAACIDAFADGFGLRAYRRPLVDEERARLHAIVDEADDGTEAVRGMVFAVLMAPQFLYHVEVAGEGDDVQFELGPYELASRLSFHFWQSLPDESLFAAAADGSILTDDGYAAQLDRVFEDPRTQATIDRFYDEWLQLGWLTQFPATPAFAAFAEGTTIGEPGADHLAAAQAEIHALTRYYTWQTDGTVADILLTDRNFTTSPHLAALYGVEPWDGQSEPPSIPGGERAGILTRTGFLVTGDHETHPVHRGAAVRRRILCEALPSPDPSTLPDGALDPPPVTEDQTTRERYEAKTADAACTTCHTMINPVGFVLERYDALGRVRSEEQVIDEATGEVLASLPIDAQAQLSFGGDAVAVGSGQELSAQIAASGKVEACFAEQYFRATFGREAAPADQCAIDGVADTLRDGSSMKDALRMIAQAPMFRSRRVE